MADVSRETPVIEPEPEVAARIFGDRIELARAFTSALSAHGEERGLIGPLELSRLWTRHILNSAVAAGELETLGEADYRRETERVLLKAASSGHAIILGRAGPLVS